ncbi:hypothetical protein VKT23_015506 [Stygiomarasmius scandens]|uniref:Uncharacterized protein n=1 Tax=Marasmiellus scandens TaxID=2682957 RepID=A0ABR1IXV6_9AGAR
MEGSSRGSLRDAVLVIQPALLTDGECVAEGGKKGKKPAYRVKDVNDGKISGWTVSRKNERWDEYKKRVNICG